MRIKVLSAAMICSAVGYAQESTIAEEPARPAGITVQQPYPGIRHVEYRGMSPRAIRVNIIQIDLTASQIRFLVTPYNAGGGRSTMKESTVQFLDAHQDEGARIAVNAHFFEPWPPPSPDSGGADLIGLAASSATAEGPGAKHGAPHAYSPFTANPPKAYALQSNAPALNIDKSNRAQIVHRRKDDMTGYRTEEDVELYNAVSGCAQIITNGTDSAPKLDWYTAPKNIRARTVMGLSRDSKTLTIFTVDGGDKEENKGMTVAEVVRFLLDDPQDLLPATREIYNALCLDGGGSSTLAMIDPMTAKAKLLNAPSHKSPIQVGSSFAVIAGEPARAK